MTRIAQRMLRKRAAIRSTEEARMAGGAGLGGLLGAIALPLTARYIFEVKNKAGLGALAALGAAVGGTSGGLLGFGSSYEPSTWRR